MIIFCICCYVTEQILDRKNAEIEEIKQHYQNKSHEKEGIASQLEKKGKSR